LNGDEFTLYRIKQLEEQVKTLRSEKADEKDLVVLAEEVRGLRRALITFSLSVVGSAVVFALAVFQLVGAG
jgi:hypothetical protein